MTCTFFGHKEINHDISLVLRNTLTDLIVNQGVKVFYVGNQGEFDILARNTLKRLKQDYPHIEYAVVLSKLPGKNINGNDDYMNTIFPEELENSPPRFAIDRRNHWMLNNSEHVICYVNRTVGGAAKFYEIAIRRKKHVINIADIIKNS